MYSITQNEARSILEPRVPVILDALDHAVKAWIDDLSHRHYVLGILTRSMFISDVWHDAVLENLVDDLGAQLCPNAPRQCLNFDDRVVVRLKLLDDKGRPRNNTTKRSVAYQYQWHLPELPPAARLDLGYRLDPIGSRVELAMFMFHKGNLPIWQWPIHRPDGTPIDNIQFEQTLMQLDEAQATGAYTQ